MPVATVRAVVALAEGDSDAAIALASQALADAEVALASCQARLGARVAALALLVQAQAQQDRHPGLAVALRRPAHELATVLTAAVR